MTVTAHSKVNIGRSSFIERRYKEAIHDRAITTPAVKFFSYQDEGRREMVRHVPFRTQEYEATISKQHRITYHRVEKWPPHPHDLMDEVRQRD